MRSYSPFERYNSLETLELRLSPTMLSVGAVFAAPAASNIQPTDVDNNDPLPEPDPVPPPYPSNDPLIEYPLLPPSGPAGPGY